MRLKPQPGGSTAVAGPRWRRWSCSPRWPMRLAPAAHLRRAMAPPRQGCRSGGVPALVCDEWKAIVSTLGQEVCRHRITGTIHRPPWGRHEAAVVIPTRTQTTPPASRSTWGGGCDTNASTPTMPPTISGVGRLSKIHISSFYCGGGGPTIPCKDLRPI
jgi:hypothetical protein